MINYITLYGGGKFFFDDIESSHILIEDISHALSNICRFNGHCDKFYSVAQHSVLVSLMVPPEHSLHALLHDAAEAYTGDIVTPLKNMLPDFKAIEKKIEAHVFKSFGLPAEIPQEVHAADAKALDMELSGLFYTTELFSNMATLTPYEACRLFMKRFRQCI